jgi:hypothetical protein
MKAIKMSLDDIVLAKRIVNEIGANLISKKGDPKSIIAYGDKKVLILEFSKRTSISGSHIENILTKTIKSPKMPKALFDCICNEFADLPDVSLELKNEFYEWKERQLGLYKSENANSIQPGFDEEQQVNKAIDTISKYFKKHKKHRKYRQEFFHFSDFQKQKKTRTTNEELYNEFPDNIEDFEKALYTNHWILYEGSADKIIRRKIKFFEKDGRIYCSAKDEETEGQISKYNCDLKVLYDRFEIRQGSILRKREDFIVYNFSYEKLPGSSGRRMVGHKMKFKRPEYTISIKMAVLDVSEQTNAIPEYCELTFLDKTIPNYIRSIFSSTEDMNIKPDPFLFISETVRNISL